ncbi:MAG: helix-turn-helix domain-containing protein [Fimbriimonadaceae bacterium]|nr:MAG: helix-turn-helix domain-containing protein [Fimbriimonadaceae bacterium]
MRELAERAGISPRTVNRIEKGHPFHESAELKICYAYSITLGTLWQVDLNQRGNRNVVRSNQYRWKFLNQEDAISYRKRQERMGHEYSDIEGYGDPDTIQEDAERSRLGLNGKSVGFQKLLSASLSKERYVAVFIELYGSDWTEPPSNIAFVNYVVEGSAKFIIQEDEYFLNVGDSLYFESDGKWTMEPWAEDGNPVLPTKVLHHCLTPLPLKKRG